MELLIRNNGKTLTLAPGETMLGAMRSSGISYSCEDGRCGMCRCHLVRGRVSEQARPPRQVFGCRARYFLACQTSLLEDTTIEVPDIDEPVIHPGGRYRARVSGVEQLSDNVRQLRVGLDQPFAFSPGQCAEVELSRGLSRLYSMAGLPGDSELRFHVRMHPHGRASQVIGQVLKAGDPVKIRGPYGTSYVRRNHSAPILCISAGTGLAPLLSVLRGIVEARMMNPVYVYAGFSAREDVYELAALNELLPRVLSARARHVLVASGPTERGLRRGLLTEAIDADLGDLTGFRVHGFGSPFAIDAVVQLLRRKGVAEEHLYIDGFHSLWS
ncbi:MAG: 2Fe-2S iron-sulfur cluster binding domain-containing protein [Panacagrimonas sp.]